MQISSNVDPITSPKYDYATPITSERTPPNIIEHNPDSDEQDFYNKYPCFGDTLATF